MRRFLCACLVCLFVVLTTADRLVCLDGCTDDAPDAVPGRAFAPCSFCQGWNHSPVLLVSRPAARRIARVPSARVTLSVPVMPPVEHPPKVA